MDVCRIHLLSHLDERREHKIHLPSAEKQGYDQQEKEQVDQQGCMEEGLSSEVIVSFRIRRACYGDDFPVIVEYRRIKDPI